MLAQLPPALQNLHLPLRLQLWDGNEFDLGPSPQVTIVVKDPQLISQFTHPSLDELGEAFVEGKLELEGDIGDVIRVCDVRSEALLSDDDDTTPQRIAHDKDTDAKAISYHYDLSNAFYQLWLDPDMAYSCGYFRDRTTRWTRPNRTSSTTCAASCACSPVTTCWMSAVAGAGCHALPHVSTVPRYSVLP